MIFAFVGWIALIAAAFCIVEAAVLVAAVGLGLMGVWISLILSYYNRVGGKPWVAEIMTETYCNYGSHGCDDYENGGGELHVI